MDRPSQRRFDTSCVRFALWACCAAYFVLDALPAAAQCPGGICRPQELGKESDWRPARERATQATATHLAAYHQAVIRVGRENPADLLPGASFAGTGTLVACNRQQGLVLTAAHVVAQGGACWVRWNNGSQRPAWLVGLDEGADLAALVVERPPAIEPIPVAEADEFPHAGQRVELCGFGGNRFRHFSAVVKGYATRDSQRSDQLVADFESINGDSGGPMLYNGKLVGILWGGPTSGPQGPIYETHGACCLRIRGFLDRLRVRLRPRPSQPPANPQPAPGAAPFVEDSPAAPSASTPIPTPAPAPRMPPAILPPLVENVPALLPPAILAPPAGSVAGAPLWSQVVSQAAAWLPALAGAGLASLGVAVPAAGVPAAAFFALRGLIGLLKKRRGGGASVPSAGPRPDSPPPAGGGAQGVVATAPDSSAGSTSSSGQQGGAAAVPPRSFSSSAVQLDDRSDEFGKQLLRLHEQEGRNPLHDATLGRVYDQQSQLLTDGGDQVAKDVIGKLRDAVKRRFDEIHPVAVKVA